MKSSDMPRATVREIDGKLVLDDPDAVAVVRAISKLNCRTLYEANQERIWHFRNRVDARGLTWQDVVIVILNVDDSNGGRLAEALMPGADWQPFRDRGEVPIARGLASREGLLDVLESFDAEAATKMRELTGIVAVLVVDHGVAEVFGS